MALRDQYGTALVTGAASGLGAAFTHMLLAQGVQVWGTSRCRERVPDREGFRGLCLELADASSVAEAWDAAEQASGGIDLVVNNAGSGVFSSMADMSPEQLQDQLQTLLLGPARLAQLAARAMRARGRGCIVTVTSLAADFPIPFMAPYSAAKAGLVALSAGLEQELRGCGVRVLEFRPGDYRTGFNQAMRAPRAPDGGDARALRVWARLERLVANAPEPARAAADLESALRRGRSGVVRSGSFFQARIAPLLQRFASQGLSRSVQRRYFELG